MTALTLLIIYCLLISLVSLLGGWLPTRLKMTHTRTQLLMSFVAGLMLGIAFYHLLPHAIYTLPEAGGVDQAVWWLMVGLLFMFVLLRMFHFHQHGHKQEECQHDHGGPGHQVNRLSWIGVALGLGLHTIIDGVALGAAVQAGIGEDAGVFGLVGLGVFVAVALHKPLDAMSIASLLMASHASAKTRMWVIGLFSLLCPLGAMLFFLGVAQFGQQSSTAVGIALAFSAGVFICISLSDLLPEVQFHSHDRLKLTLALLLGITAAYGIGMLEPAHGHHEDEESHHALFTIEVSADRS
ncbi:ZIP family metal transporter [Oceanicoccus sp. KOV_DT_Chl]|uniref:ZIP family metal transporter n=1 Tax=Oceanicoccus sp. KOV_DT_Chl TaxID=1904639 RepID=UPI000C7D5D70|nr:ZIP family metal transporter [Oceanicoccus sp. KOV_DT_Chl]